MDMEFDDLEECFEVDSIADEVEKLDDDDVGSAMKDLMRKMMRLIIKQDGESRRLKTVKDTWKIWRTSKQMIYTNWMSEMLN